MEFNAGVFDLNGVFLKKNYVIEGMRIIDPKMYAKAKQLLSRDKARVENVADVYDLYPENKVDEKIMEAVSWAATRKDYTIKPVLDLIKKQPLELIIITTNSGPYDTLRAKYKYLNPLTSAKIIPFTPELRKREDGLMELNPESFYDAHERGIIARTVSEEYCTLTMGDKEGDDTNDELVRSGDIGIEFNDKSKKGFQFNKRENLFTEVRYSDLPDIEKIINDLPQPEKEKKGFIEKCLNETARETVQEGYFAVSPALCATGCVI